MRLEEAYSSWRACILTQEEAALILGVNEHTFRCYLDGYEENCLDGLVDKGLALISHYCAPVDEVMALVETDILFALDTGHFEKE